MHSSKHNWHNDKIRESKRWRVLFCSFAGSADLHAHPPAGVLLPVPHRLWPLHLFLAQRGLQPHPVLQGEFSMLGVPVHELSHQTHCMVSGVTHCNVGSFVLYAARWIQSTGDPCTWTESLVSLHGEWGDSLQCELIHVVCSKVSLVCRGSLYMNWVARLVAWWVGGMIDSQCEFIHATCCMVSAVSWHVWKWG